MSVLKNPYKGVRGLRYSFMEQNAPEDLARMEAAGKTEEYLKAVEHNYLLPRPYDRRRRYRQMRDPRGVV